MSVPRHDGDTGVDFSTFQLPGARGLAGLLRDIIAGLAESVRETLPEDEHEAGVFMAGMCWAFCLFWTCLILTTWLWLLGAGR